MRRLVEHGVPVVLVAAHASLPHDPCPGHARHFLVPGRRCTASTRFSAAYREQANARTGSARACGQTVKQASEDPALSCRFQSQDSTCVSADTAFPSATRSITLKVGAGTTVGQISCMLHRHGLFAGPCFPAAVGTPARSALIMCARALRASLEPLTPPLRNARRDTGLPVAASLRAIMRA